MQDLYHLEGSDTYGTERRRQQHASQTPSNNRHGEQGSCKEKTLTAHLPYGETLVFCRFLRTWLILA